MGALAPFLTKFHGVFSSPCAARDPTRRPARKCRRPEAPSVAPGMAGLAVVVLTGSIDLVTSDAWASIPSQTTGEITGCFAKSGGTLRVIDKDANQVCSSKESQLVWNTKGPQGLTGPAGA